MTPLDNMMDMSNKLSKYIDTFHEHLVIVIEIVLWLMYYLNMIYISLDKMFVIHFHLKYPIYCCLNRAKILLVTTWSVVVILFVVVVILYVTDVTDYYPYIWYVYFVLDVVYIVVAVSTFVFIYQKYNESLLPPCRPYKRRPSSSVADKLLNVRSSSRLKSFRRSSFFIVVLRICCFLVFKVTSNLVFFFICVPNRGDNMIVMMIVFVMWALSDLLDALMNILQNKSLLRECKKNLHHFNQSLRASFNIKAKNVKMNLNSNRKITCPYSHPNTHQDLPTKVTSKCSTDIVSFGKMLKEELIIDDR